MVSTTRRFTWALGLVGLAVVAVGTLTAFNMGYAASQRELIGKRPVTCKLWSEGRNEHLTDEDKHLCRQLHYAPPTQAILWLAEKSNREDKWRSGRTTQGNAEADRAVVGKQMFDDLAGTYYKAVDRASAEGKVIDDKKTFEFYNDMAEIINDNKQFDGEKQVQYLKLPVTASCLADTLISTGKECSQAIAALGIVGLNTRWEQPNGTPLIPLGCSVREDGNDRRAHFNLNEEGSSRKDLAPICSVKARAPPAPQTGEMGLQQKLKQVIENRMRDAIMAAKKANDIEAMLEAQRTGKYEMDMWMANQAAMFGSAAVY